MNTSVHLLLGLAATGLAAALLGLAFARGLLGLRRTSVARDGGSSALRPILSALAPFVARQRSRDAALDRTLSAYERQIVQSGGTFLGGATAAEVFVARFALPALAILGFSVVGALLRLSPGLVFLLALVFAVLLYHWPEQALADLVRRRLQAFSRDLPQTLDIMRLVSQSGGDLSGAIRTVVEVSPPGPVRDELAHVLGEVAIGTSLARALTNVAERIGSPDANAVFSTMAQALEMGTGVAENLGSAAQLMRKAARIRAQERAQKAVVAMTFPLLLLILPGVFIVLFAPLIIQYVTR